MASCRKVGKSWKFEVRKSNPAFYSTATFPTKQEGTIWATQIEAEWYAEKRGKVPNKPYRDLLDRYAADVSVKKAGARWELLRCALIGRDPLGDVLLPTLDATHFVAWRDRRLKQVSAATVRREWTLLNHANNVAVKEWRWLKVNPLPDVERPPPAEDRDRRITKKEIELLLVAFGWDDEPVNKSQRVCASFQFAIETGMRTSEICALTWPRVFEHHLHLPKSKNGKKRDVPLFASALKILAKLPRVEREPEEIDYVFNLKPSQVDSLFRKARDLTPIEDLHFHDTRHEAITRLATVRKMGILDLARMVGITNLKQLMTYYNRSAEDVAKGTE